MSPFVRTRKSPFESYTTLEAKILAGKQATGRTGMDLWQILVLGVVRLGLDADWDRMEDLAILALRAELEAERKARAAADSGRKSAETKAAEAERHAQELKALHLTQPAPVPSKAKRGFPTLLNHSWN